MNTNIESLKAEKDRLVDEIRKTSRIERDEAIFERIREIEAEIAKIETLNTLKAVNRQQAEKRRLAKIAWECEQPEVDITTNSGDFHAVKVKKYPKLAALQYGRAKVKDGKIVELKFSGENFTMMRTVYEYGKPDRYERPADFSDFLNLNYIHPEEITEAEYMEMIAENDRINKEMQEAIEKYEAEKSRLNLFRLSHIGLFEQRSAKHLYEYRKA